MPKTLIETFSDVADIIVDNKEYLTDLDSAIGDGDHGINMAKGFSKVKEGLNNKDFDSNGEILKTVAMTLISNVGGASGPLYGTAFLNVSKTVGDIDEITVENLIKIGESAIEGIKKRGKAEKGEKTMLDAIIPAVESLRESKNKGLDLKSASEKCLDAAKEGMESTTPMLATKGRASYLGERSKGHQDPGATSSYLIIKTMINHLLEKV